MKTQELVEKVRLWGAEKGIIGPEAKATPLTQFEKLLEEVEELHQGIAHNKPIETIDAIGDCTVVLILLAELCSFRFEDCLHSAYDEIKKRTGRMIDGKFVKD